MQIVVTGGAGFIGSHVVDRLVDAGHDVTVADLRPPHRPDVGFAPIDLADLPSLVGAFAGAEVVFHLAAVADVNTAFADPVGTVDANVSGTARVCEACRQAGVGRIVLASTVWVYGAAVDGDGPLDEDASIDLTRAGHLYTSSKLAAELVVHSYQELYGLDFTILRYGIPYGTRMRDSLVIPKFVQMALDGDPITLQGDGSQYRNYVHVEDLAAAHVLALRDEAANQVFNLEGAEPVAIRDLVDHIGTSLGRPPAVEFVPARTGDYEGRPVSADKAGRVLGWAPRIAFADGLRSYVTWRLAQRQGEAAAATAAGAARRPRLQDVRLLALACLVLPLLAAAHQGGLGVVAGLAGVGAALLAFAFSLKRPIGRALAAGATVLAVWLLAQTSPGPVSAVVGLLLGVGVAGIVQDGDTEPVVAVRLVPAGVVVAALTVLSAADPKHLFWGAALVPLAALASRRPRLTLVRLRSVTATFSALLLAAGAFCVVGATSASAAWFGPIVTHGSRSVPSVAVTFHGKIDPTTLGKLDASLREAGVAGTFFLPASALSSELPATRALLDDGNLLADYPYGRGVSALLDTRSRPLTESQAAFNSAVSLCPTFVRPAEGRHTPLMAWVAHGQGVRIVTWDNLAPAARTGSPGQVAQHVLDHSRPGSIIAFDFDDAKTAAQRDTLVAALPALLRGLQRRGLTPVRLDSLLAASPYGARC